MPLPHNKPCGAKKRREGGICQQVAMANGRCKQHGGKSLSGLAHPGLKTGRFSKAMPASLLANYEAARRDPDLLSLRDDLSVLDARLIHLLGRIDSDGGLLRWEKLRDATGGLVVAIRTRDYSGMDRRVDELESLIDDAASDASSWREIYDVMDTRRKLASEERKRLLAMEQTITTERAMVFVTALVDVVRKNVADRRALHAIQQDLRRILGPATLPGRASDPDGGDDE